MLQRFRLDIQENSFMERVVQPCYRAVVEPPSLELFKSIWMWPWGSVVALAVLGECLDTKISGFSSPNDSMILYSITLLSLVLFPSRRTWSSWCRSCEGPSTASTSSVSMKSPVVLEVHKSGTGSTPHCRSHSTFPCRVCQAGASHVSCSCHRMFHEFGNQAE